MTEQETQALAAQVRAIINEHAEYMDGFDRGQVNFGRDAVVRMIEAALRTPSPTIEGAVAAEREAIVNWLRRQSDKGAEFGIAAEHGTTKRAAFGGGSLALHRAANEIERGNHIIDAIAEALANGGTESQQ